MPQKSSQSNKNSKKKTSNKTDITVDEKGICAKGSKSSAVSGTGFMSNGRDFVMSSFEARAENYEKGIRDKGSKSSAVSGTGLMSNGKDFVVSSVVVKVDNYGKKCKK